MGAENVDPPSLEVTNFIVSTVAQTIINVPSAATVISGEKES
jgi:hypothetical protein